MIATEIEESEETEPIQDTLSTAPTVLVGFDSDDRMLDVRPSSHIPGKRRAPKPPKVESNYEKLGNFAKVNKVQKINEGNLSPRSWFRKNKKDMTIPNKNAQKNDKNRPISLLASISDFDRQAAKIVEQRNEEKRKRVNDESFYVTQNQEAIDEIMANVEQKMECLDAIGKHNNRWEKRISEDSIPSIDMNGIVSDLNQFLNTSKKEMMTPRSKRKQEIKEAKLQGKKSKFFKFSKKF